MLSDAVKMCQLYQFVYPENWACQNTFSRLLKKRKKVDRDFSLPCISDASVCKIWMVVRAVAPGVISESCRGWRESLPLWNAHYLLSRPQHIDSILAVSTTRPLLGEAFSVTRPTEAGTRVRDPLTEVNKGVTHSPLECFFYYHRYVNHLPALQNSKVC